MNKDADTIFASASRTATVSSSDFVAKSKGVRLYLDITAASGTTPTLDLKVQIKDSLSGTYHDLTGASFAQKTTTGSDYLTIYPGIAETANEAVSDILGQQFKVVATIGGTSPNFTFSLWADYLE